MLYVLCWLMIIHRILLEYTCVNADVKIWTF